MATLTGRVVFSGTLIEEAPKQINNRLSNLSPEPTPDVVWGGGADQRTQRPITTLHQR